MPLTTETAMFGHISPETAFVVDDYPYGYTLRTQIRYWLESKAKFGDRLMSQTMNPKTGRWNKPKASTYTKVGAMFLDGKGHVTWTGIYEWSDEDQIAEFLAVAKDYLNEIQKANLAHVIGVNKTFKDVTFTIKEGQQTPEEKAEQAKVEQAISKRVAIETYLAKQEL